MNLVNPKVMIFFLAFFPAFLWNTSENTVSQFFILGITFMFISFLTFSSLAVLAGSIKQFVTKQKMAGKILKWLQIIVFVGISVYILLP
jgi:threonine/homoserine/homoserine lactone efflux protein